MATFGAQLPAAKGLVLAEGGRPLQHIGMSHLCQIIVSLSKFIVRPKLRRITVTEE